MSAHLRAAWATLQTKASGTKLYHLTAKDDFKPNPKYHPQNNTTLGGDWPEPGIFLTDDPERWCNGYGYWQPWVVEFEVPSGVGTTFKGSETFVPATEFDRLRITRVLPLDAYCREEYGEWGWTEEHFGTDFETGQKVDTSEYGKWQGYRYTGDARRMDPAWKAAYKKRVRAFARTRTNAIASKTASDYWHTQPDREVYEEWLRFAWNTIKDGNDRHQMWGKVWPIYRGQGDNYLAHEGIAYYGGLNLLLEMEAELRRRGLPLPARPDLIGPKGEVHPGRPGEPGTWEGMDPPEPWEEVGDFWTKVTKP